MNMVGYNHKLIQGYIAITSPPERVQGVSLHVRVAPPCSAPESQRCFQRATSERFRDGQGAGQNVVTPLVGVRGGVEGLRI
jgi:hypothetical protein